jgi:hypothetical protein
LSPDLRETAEKALGRVLRAEGEPFSAIGFRALVAGRVLPIPHVVLIGSHGRAVAWYADGRPFVLYPSLAELTRMHGVECVVARAA